MSLLFVLRNVDRAFLRRRWRLESVERRHRFLDLLAACVATFEYDRANAKGAHPAGPVVRLCHVGEEGAREPAQELKSQEPGKEGNKLNCSVVVLLLDVVEDFVEDFAPEMATPDGTSTLERVLALLVNLLERPQALRFLESLFASLRAFLSRFRSRLFSENSSVLYALAPLPAHAAELRGDGPVRAHLHTPHYGLLVAEARSISPQQATINPLPRGTA